MWYFYRKVYLTLTIEHQMIPGMQRQSVDAFTKYYNWSAVFYVALQGDVVGCYSYSIMAQFILWLFCIPSLLQLVHGYATYQERIPNGNRIPSPCNPALSWHGVGHQARGGGGPRNPFGLAFEASGFIWTVKLCQADPDNDMKTNGEELGDPNCVWSTGSQPNRTVDLSHPGICEPLDSPTCKAVNTFLPDCTETEFKCDAVKNDKDIQKFDVRLGESAVPVKETTYMCQVLDLPTDGDYHLVAFEPFIVNRNVMHHALAYACTDDAIIEERHRLPSECVMTTIEECSELIALWAIGAPGICYHEDAGFRVGVNGYKRVMLQTHWNNPMFESDYTDSSGFTLYLTPHLRSNDAGMMMFGQAVLMIPPGQMNYTENSTCSSECTKRSMQGNINIMAAANHMHYLGASIVSQLVSHDGTVHVLSSEKEYEFDSPKVVVFDKPIVMEPGYKMQLYCHFNSMSRTETTYYGKVALEEMCYSFIMYYPKSNWQAEDCVSLGPYDTCGIPTGESDGYCDYGALLNQTHPDTIARYIRLNKHCEAGYCKDGCIDVVRDIFKEPCFNGIHLKNIKKELRSEYLDISTKLAIYDFFYRLDSCNAELAREECEWRGSVTGAVSSNTASFVFVTTAVFIASL